LLDSTRFQKFSPTKEVGDGALLINLPFPLKTKKCAGHILAVDGVRIWDNNNYTYGLN